MRIDILGPTGSGRGILSAIIRKALEDAGIKVEAGDGKGIPEYSLIVRETPKQLHDVHDQQRRGIKANVKSEPIYDVVLTVTEQGVLSSFKGISDLPPGTYKCRVAEVR